MTADLSVVVPTRDRPESLRACLVALAGQREVELEVVVVDDGSLDRDAVADVIAEAAPARTTVVRGGGDGPARARNLGARRATAPVVAFTDDDCRPVPTWAASLLAVLDVGAVAVSGATVNGRPGDPWAAAAQVVTNHLTESGLAPDGRSTTFAPTCNLAVRRTLADELPFDETFPLAAGEDREWCDRLRAAGHVLAHEPAAVVHHPPDLGWRGFWRQQERYGRGAHHLRTTTAGGSLQAPGFYLGLLRAGFAVGPRVGALVIVAQLATTVGVLRATLAR